jgi:hypothetical protein
MSRRVFHISHLDKDDIWTLKEEGLSPLMRYPTKSAAVDAAAALASEIKDAGGFAQVIIHRKDGAFEEERTYGKDPRRSPG